MYVDATDAFSLSWIGAALHTCGPERRRWRRRAHPGHGPTIEIHPRRSRWIVRGLPSHLRISFVGKNTGGGAGGGRWRRTLHPTFPSTEPHTYTHIERERERGDVFLFDGGRVGWETDWVCVGRNPKENKVEDGRTGKTSTDGSHTTRGPSPPPPHPPEGQEGVGGKGEKRQEVRPVCMVWVHPTKQMEQIDGRNPPTHEGNDGNASVRTGSTAPCHAQRESDDTKVCRVISSHIMAGSMTLHVERAGPSFPPPHLYHERIQRTSTRALQSQTRVHPILLDPCGTSLLRPLSHRNIPLNLQCPPFESSVPSILGSGDPKGGHWNQGFEGGGVWRTKQPNSITETCRTKPCACNKHRNLDARRRRGRDRNMRRSESPKRTSRCVALRRNLETCT